MSKKQGKGQNVIQNAPAGQALVVGQPWEVSGVLENVGTPPGNLIEGGFSTKRDAIYPEGTGRKPAGEMTGKEGQVDKGGRPTVLDDNPFDDEEERVSG